MCRRQSQRISLAFFNIMAGFTSDLKNLILSFGGICVKSLISAIVRYIKMKHIPIIKGITKSSYPPAILSLISINL